MKRQNVFLLVFLAVMGVTGSVLYFGFFGTSFSTAFPPLPMLPFFGEQMLREDDLAVFTDPQFEELLAPPGLPVIVGPGGRINPFAPR